MQKKTGKDSLTIADIDIPGLLNSDLFAAVCKWIGSRSDAATAKSILAVASTGFRKLSPILIFLNVVNAWRHCRIFDMHPDPLPWLPALRRQGVTLLINTGHHAN